MRKALALALAASLLVAGAAAAFTDVQADLAIVAQTADTVTVSITQTAGDPARMKYIFTCHQVNGPGIPDTLATWQEFRVESGDVITTSLGPYKRHGQLVRSDACDLILDLPAGGGAAYELDRLILYP